MTTNKLNGRQLLNPRGRDPAANICLLADCLAASGVDLFSEDNSVILVANGKKAAVTFDMLREICLVAVVTKQIVERDGIFEAVLVPYEPDHMTLRALLNARSLHEGSLALRLPKAPSVQQLSIQIRQQVSDRLRRGETAQAIATQLNCEVETIEALRGGAGVARNSEIPWSHRAHAAAVKRQDG